MLVPYQLWLHDCIVPRRWDMFFFYFFGKTKSKTPPPFLPPQTTQQATSFHFLALKLPGFFGIPSTQRCRLAHQGAHRPWQLRRFRGPWRPGSIHTAPAAADWLQGAEEIHAFQLQGYPTAFWAWRFEERKWESKKKQQATCWTVFTFVGGDEGVFCWRKGV